ncbi:MAG: putative PEP-binding protein [bacterium]
MERGWYIEDIYELRRLPASSTNPILVKTGWVFLNRLSFPSPEEQLKKYLECSSLGNWTPIIFALAEFSSLNGRQDTLIATELKDFRHLDGYLLWKNCPKIFDSQIRALLKASYFRKAWIALPSIRKKSELHSALATIEKIMDQLNDQRSPFDRYPKVGVKINSIFALRHIEDLLESDFLIFDFDSIFTHLLGIPFRSPVLRDYLGLMEEEMETLLRWLEPVPFEEKWCGFISALLPEEWKKTGQLGWEAYFRRILPENE